MKDETHATHATIKRSMQPLGQAITALGAMRTTTLSLLTTTVLTLALTTVCAAQPPRQSPPGALAQQSYDVELFYNKSTGELYPLLPQGAAPHTCVWTIWGDHGSDTKLVTEKPFISAALHAVVRANKFLPPRVPIYVTCVDWQNTTYRGSIGAYR